MQTQQTTSALQCSAIFWAQTFLTQSFPASKLCEFILCGKAFETKHFQIRTSSENVGLSFSFIVLYSEQMIGVRENHLNLINLSSTGNSFRKTFAIHPSAAKSSSSSSSSSSSASKSSSAPLEYLLLPIFYLSD